MTTILYRDMDDELVTLTVNSNISFLDGNVCFLSRWNYDGHLYQYEIPIEKVVNIDLGIKFE